MNKTETSDGLERAQRQQLAALAARQERGEALAGWKVGLTSGSSRDAFGAGFRPFGYLLDSGIYRSGHTFWWSSTVGQQQDDLTLEGGIENELCFEFAQQIDAPVNAAEVRQALASVAPAFELTQNRLQIQGAAPSNEERLADNLSHWGLVVGDPVPIPDNFCSDELTVRLLHNADGVSSVAGRDHMDDHFHSLAGLCNRLLDYGLSVQAGQQVITGAFGRMSEPKRGLWSGDFGELGRVHLRIER